MERVMTTATLENALLDVDFYHVQELLSDVEQERAVRIRDFLEREVTPIIEDHWERAEFPHRITPGFPELGVYGPLWEESRLWENTALYRGWVALEFGRNDASVATFVGVHSGLAMNAIGMCGDAAQRAEWLPKMARGELIGAFGLTEPLHGSDTARGLETTARREGDEWVLNGAKRWIG
ncbi:acyl-CoA dehydrogenase, partial [Schumannella luteola]